MGGYGVLNAAGAGYSQNLADMFSAMTGGNKAIEVLCMWAWEAIRILAGEGYDNVEILDGGFTAWPFDIHHGA